MPEAGELAVRRDRPSHRWERALRKQDFRTLMRRLSEIGLSPNFVRSAVLPDWWNKACESDPALMPEVELRVSRFLDTPITTVQDRSARLAVPTVEGAQLRRVRDIDKDRLWPAIHAAMKISEAAVRNLRDPSTPRGLPKSAMGWREEIAPDGPVSLARMASDLWSRGVLVIPVDELPNPRFQGLASIVRGRPVIVLGHKHDEPGRVAFFLAHEAGHIAAGDCVEGPVVDEEEEVGDESALERRADEFASNVLLGAKNPPALQATTFTDLAKEAHFLESKTGADASYLIYSWARRHKDYATATRAVQALYRSTGARRILRDHFVAHVDIESASESDHALLSCVHGAVASDEPAR